MKAMHGLMTRRFSTALQDDAQQAINAYLLAISLTGDSLSLWVPVAFFVLTFVVVDAFPDIVIRTYVSKGHINMGLMLLAYVLGTIAFGWYGLFLGPLVLVVFIHFVRRVLPNLVEASAFRFVTD